MNAHQLSKAKSPLHAAGMHLAGVKRLGTPEQIAHAERDLATVYLERYVERAIATGVAGLTRRRIAKTLIAGGAQ